MFDGMGIIIDLRVHEDADWSGGGRCRVSMSGGVHKSNIYGRYRSVDSVRISDCKVQYRLINSSTRNNILHNKNVCDTYHVESLPP